MEEANIDEILETLEKPTYTEILLCITSGKNYATSIAKFLSKKQPTVTEQLVKLEKLGIIFPKERKKAKKYEVNWNVLLEIFYGTVREVIEAREEYLSSEEANEIRKTKLEEVIPPELIKEFLKEYFLILRDLGGKRKGFDEIIFSFFSALNNLEKSYWKKLIRKFGINEEALSIIANLMELEISGVEQTAIMSYLDLSESKAWKTKNKRGEE